MLNNFQNDLGYDLKLDVLSEQDAYVSHTDIPEATVYISADGGGAGETLSFAEIDSKLSASVPAPTDPAAGDYDLNSLKAAEYIAALNFSVGVMLKADYSPVWGTAAFNSSELFLRCGFKSANIVRFSDLNETERSFWVTANTQLSKYLLTDDAIAYIDDIYLQSGNYFVTVESVDKGEWQFNTDYTLSAFELKTLYPLKKLKSSNWNSRFELFLLYIE